MKMCALFLALLAGFGLAPRVLAQSIYHCPLPSFPSSCSPIYWPGYSGLLTNLPAVTVCCNPDGTPNGEDCITPRLACLLPKTKTDICLTCLLAGSPINLSTGNTFIVESDINLPGLGGGLHLTRTWNSILPALQNTFPMMFGTNWRSTYEERLILNSPDLMLKYARGDGSVWSFGLVSTGPYTYHTAAPANDTTTITQGAQAFTLLYKNGEKRTFDLGPVHTIAEPR